MLFHLFFFLYFNLFSRSSGSNGKKLGFWEVEWRVFDIIQRGKWKERQEVDEEEERETEEKVEPGKE